MTKISRTVNLESALASATDKANIKRKFIIAGRDLTFGEAVDRIQLLRRLYRDAGLKTGDRVVLCTRDDVEAGVLFLSLFLSGITAVLVDPSIKPDRAISLITSIRPRGVILDGSFRQAWDPAGAGFVLEIDGSSQEKKGTWSGLLGKKETGAEASTYPAVLKKLVPADWPAETAPDSGALVSVNADGATTHISRGETLQRLRAIGTRLSLSPKSKILINYSSMSQAAGLLLGPLAAFLNTATLYYPSVSGDAGVAPLLDSIYRDRITHFVTDSRVFSQIIDSHKSRLDSFQGDEFQFIVSTGGVLSESERSNFETAFHAPIVDLAAEGEPAELFGSCGAAESASSSHQRDAWMKEIEVRIIQAAAPCFKEAPADLSLQTGLHDTKGWDSFAHLELITVLEMQFKIQFTSAEVMRIKRLSDACTIIAEKLS